jgi:hypothetical protein
MNIGRPSSLISALALGALLSTTLHLAARQPSQTRTAAAPVPVFDVVAIHENKSPSDNMSIRWGGDAYVATNTTLTSLLMGAYGIREDLISGLPGWANSVHFDVNAKVSDPDADALKKLSREQRQAMMVALLKDRFHTRHMSKSRRFPSTILSLRRAVRSSKRTLFLLRQVPIRARHPSISGLAAS